MAPPVPAAERDRILAELLDRRACGETFRANPVQMVGKARRLGRPDTRSRPDHSAKVSGRAPIPYVVCLSIFDHLRQVVDARRGTIVAPHAGLSQRLPDQTLLGEVFQKVRRLGVREREPMETPKRQLNAEIRIKDTQAPYEVERTNEAEM